MVDIRYFSKYKVLFQIYGGYMVDIWYFSKYMALLLTQGKFANTLGSYLFISYIHTGCGNIF